MIFAELGDRIIYTGIGEGYLVNTYTMDLMIRNLIVGNYYIVDDIRKYFEFLGSYGGSIVYYRLKELNFWAPFYIFRLDANFLKERMKDKYNLK